MSPVRADDGHEILHHLLGDLLVKGAVVLVAVVLVVVLATVLWRRLS